MYFRHDSPRLEQKKLMEDMYAALLDHKNFMAQAPTGLGKTDASLAAALTYALEKKLTVFFLTPKISQHKIAIESVNGIAKKYSLDIKCVDLVGRMHCCIDDSLTKLDSESFQSSCTKKRKNRECKYYTNVRGNNVLSDAKAESKFKVVLDEYGIGKSHEELIKMGIKAQCCPYEWLLKIAERSNVIIADYYHLLVPQIRDVFLMKIKKRIEDSIVIIDEAHNLSSRIRQSLSFSLNSFILRRVEKEMKYLKIDPGPIELEFSNWAIKKLQKDEQKMIDTMDFVQFISDFGFDYETITDKLDEIGNEFIESTSKKSACLKFSQFLLSWLKEEEGSARILKRKGANYYLSKKILDPSSATKMLNNFAGTILMSGTLMPLKMHRDILGLSDSTIMKEYQSPFDPKNVINLVTPHITTKYSRRNDETFELVANKIDQIIRSTPGGVAVFFPSYAYMDKILSRIQSRNLLIQKSAMKSHEIKKLIHDFKNGGVLCAVQGGSLSEGVDFSNGEIKTAIIVGVGLDEMNLETKALIEYYDKKFGLGWDYGYLYPGTIKAVQAAGRGRRKESDRLVVVYMDERFMWQKYNWILNKKEKLLVTENPEFEVEKFWK